MSSLRPLVCSTTSAVTVTPSSADLSLVTVLPSTTSSAGSVTVAPGSPASRSTSTTSPTATLCWWPPPRTIAYTLEVLPTYGDCAQDYRTGRPGLPVQALASAGSGSGSGEGSGSVAFGGPAAFVARRPLFFFGSGRSPVAPLFCFLGSGTPFRWTFTPRPPHSG